MKKFQPLTIEITFGRDADGELLLQYAGDDDRTHEIGAWVVEAIAETINHKAEFLG